MIPNASAGVNPLNGKKNPVTLVAAVVIRDTAVQLSSRFSINSPNTTTNPEKIPIKLNNHVHQSQGSHAQDHHARSLF